MFGEQFLPLHDDGDRVAITALFCQIAAQHVGHGIAEEEETIAAGQGLGADRHGVETLLERGLKRGDLGAP